MKGPNKRSNLKKMIHPMDVCLLQATQAWLVANFPKKPILGQMNRESGTLTPQVIFLEYLHPTNFGLPATNSKGGPDHYSSNQILTIFNSKSIFKWSLNVNIYNSFYPTFSLSLLMQQDLPIHYTYHKYAQSSREIYSCH